MRKNKCSLKVIKNGRRLHGTAAILHMTSKEGGFDSFLQNFAQNVAKSAVRDFISEQSKPRLVAVK